MTASTTPKKILFLTGTRADFGKLKPLILATQSDPAFETRVFATGMHLLARYGETIGEIYKAGVEHVYPFINQDASVTSQMDLVLSTTIAGLGHYVREFRPDLLVIHGDRVETLAGAAVGSLNFILSAHVEGGEVSGTVDELLRHSISKLSHVHFVSNDQARQRLIQMGEVPKSIFTIGSPEVDIMLSESLPSLEEVRSRYDVPFDRFILLLFHPDVSELEQLSGQVEEVFAALEEAKVNVVALYPNNDQGSEVILKELEVRSASANFHVLPSLRFEYFLALLKHADAILGNSSAGIREAPVYGTPTINLGRRQSNRFRHESIRDLDFDRSAIKEFLSQNEDQERFAPALYFGKGHSSEEFMATLRGADLWMVDRQKLFLDLTPTGSLIAREDIQ